MDLISRSAIVTMSALCIIGAVALTPTRVRSSADTAGRLEPNAVHALTLADVPEMPVRRDPFSGEPSVQPAVPAPPAAQPAAPAAPAAGFAALPPNLPANDIPALPSDAGVSGGAAGAANTARVIAIVTGNHPYAMLDTGGNHEIKGVGDRVAGAMITAIDIGGVTLAGGRRLSVAPGETGR